MFRNGALKAETPTRSPCGSFVFPSPAQMSAQHTPISVRAPTQVIKVPAGFRLISMVPKASIPKHCTKLVSPKVSPSTAPIQSPFVSAPTITGMVIKVIESRPIFR